MLNVPNMPILQYVIFAYQAYYAVILKFRVKNSSKVTISFPFIKFSLRITMLGLVLGLGLRLVLGLSLVCSDN